MGPDEKTIDLKPEEYRSSDGRFVWPRLPDRMHPFRRFLCVALGLPLLGAGVWLFCAHVAGVGFDHLVIRVVLAAGALAFGGVTLIGSGVTGR